jgi:hypothetical protein
LEFPSGTESGLDPLDGDIPLLVGIGAGGEELDADFGDSDVDQAGEADGAEDEVGDLLADKVGDDNMLARFEGLSGEEGEAAGGEVAGVDVGPRLSGAAGDAEPHGVDVVDAWADAAVGGGGGGRRVEAGDDGTDPVGLFARKSDMFHDVYLPLELGRDRPWAGEALHIGKEAVGE